MFHYLDGEYGTKTGAKTYKILFASKQGIYFFYDKQDSKDEGQNGLRFAIIDLDGDTEEKRIKSVEAAGIYSKMAAHLKLDV